MQFTVLDVGSRPPSAARDKAFLIKDNWDDWFKFKTQYMLLVVDSKGETHRIGDVKIGQFGMKKDQSRPELPPKFTDLGDEFFSIGQDDSYYEGLNRLGETTRDEILTALKDMAADDELFGRAIKEQVTRESLLRSVTPVAVQG